MLKVGGSIFNLIAFHAECYYLNRIFKKSCILFIFVYFYFNKKNLIYYYIKILIQRNII